MAVLLRFLLGPMALLAAIVTACSQPAPTPVPSPESTPAAPAIPTAGPAATPTAASQPTAKPVSPEREWVKDRLLALVTLYDISDEGRDLLLSLDVRQMSGQPGFFGSYGFKSWTGVGEAKPSTIMHEVGHAYWGAFPVTGFAELSWDAQGDAAGSAAMERYHRDVLEFMKQPPGHYELFRSRLRNIPELSESNLDGLFHSVEADVVYNVAGDLHLLPPILHKYWDRFLNPGPWRSWYEAAGWFRTLSGKEAPVANQYMGFEHMDLRRYGSLSPAQAMDLPQRAVDTLHREERQRLRDFADQFGALIGDPDREENFDFWRGYLRDMRRLHQAHPGVLVASELPMAGPVSEALDFLVSLEGKGPEDKAGSIRREAGSQPVLLHFLPALDNRTLLELFAQGVPLPDSNTLRGTAAFVERLNRFAPAVQEVLGLDTESGAAALADFLEAQDFENKGDLDLLFQLLRDADHATARRTTSALDDRMIWRLIRAVPATLRSLLDAQRLLEALDITRGSPPDDLAEGIDMLITYPSGNFLIDEPFLAELYEVVAERARRSAVEALGAIRESPFPLEGFIRRHPDEAVALLAVDLDVAAAMVTRSDPVLFPPARFVYRLIDADPRFAARLVGRLDDRGEAEVVVESLAHIAYDADRLEAVPGFPISLEQDGRFLESLLEERGTEWLLARTTEAIRLYGARIEQGDVPEDFLRAYKATLGAAIETVPGGRVKEALTRMLREVFQTGPG